MPEHHGNVDLPQWLSITGQPLQLSPQSSFRGNCASMDSYEKLNQLGEGTYGIVYRAQGRLTARVVALKQVRITAEERRDGLPITIIREISILRSLKHSNIINVIDVAVGQDLIDDVYMVMEYAEQNTSAPSWLIFRRRNRALEEPLREYQDLASMLDELNVKFSMSEAKCLIRQLLEGIEYLHKNDIIHRDVKMQNILLTASGVLKLADFGMARPYSPRPLTPGVVTIWYRAPEVLLGTKYYTPSVDLWSAGLVLAELLQNTPCLTGETPIEQLSLIVKLLGSPTPEDHAALSSMGCPDHIRWRREGLASGRADNMERRFLPHTSPETVDFLQGLLKWDPQARWTAAEALGNGGNKYAVIADRWWRASPRAADKVLPPTKPRVRDSDEAKLALGRSEVDHEDTAREKDGYVFDFGDQSVVRRPHKRPRAR